MDYRSTKNIMIILLTVAAFFVFASLWGFYSATHPPKIVSVLTPRDLGLQYEAVSFRTADGIELRGWFVPHASEKKKGVILLHGYPADKGDILPAMAFLAKRYPLLLFDFRYFGESGGGYTTAGVRETEDLRAAILFLKGRGMTEIGVWGFSMGGAVALMMAPDEPEIKAVIAESSYASLDAMARALYRLPILREPLGWLTGLWARLFLNVDLHNAAPAEAVRQLTIPVLILHSKDDNMIPFTHALRLQEALAENHSAEFWFEDTLRHGELGEAYENRIREFFLRHL